MKTGTISLTQQADNLEGTAGDDTFAAPVTQNETGSGALANTLETGDVLNGGEGTDTLRADLIATGTIQDGGFGAAISAETDSIENVFLRSQVGQQDNNADNSTFASTIDAEKMVGVEQWWTDGSRADVRIEDVRSRPVDTVLGMRETDPEVGYEVYFNPLFMEGGQTSQSQLVIQIAELDGGNVNTAAELESISVSALSFELAGESVTLASDEMAAANTWAELETALVAELEAAGLGDLEVTRGDNGQFLLFDAEGRAFSNQGGFTATATTDQQIDIRNRITQEVETQEEKTETTLVLDGAGNGSRGGDVNIAAMSGDRGIEVINVAVDRDSHIFTLRSENNPNDTGSFSTEQQLEEVNLTHLADGAEGDFQLGGRTVGNDGVSRTIDDRLNTDGLLDVRAFDATGYSSSIKLGAALTANVFDKYLAGAEDTVQFSYLLGDGGNNFSLDVDNTVASDGDFALEIVGGAEDDRVNLTGLAVKDSTSVNGDEGVNTVEINTTTGATADFDGNYATGDAVEFSAGDTAFAGFENIDRLVIAGGNDTRQNIVDGNLTAIDGQEVVIATGLVPRESDAAIVDFDFSSGFDIDANGNLVDSNNIIVDQVGNPILLDDFNTDIAEASIDTELTVSGKNQTLGSGNNNNDQFVGTVQALDTRGIPNRSDLDVTLDNTARLDGELTVADLNVGTTAGGTSAVRTLDLTSAGRRSTENLVQSANLAGVNTVNLDGSQNLDLHIAEMQENASGASTNSTVNGAELGGNLDLAMNADILNRSNDVLTGTASDSDSLAVYGAGARATVRDFETVQLGLAADNQFNEAITGFEGTFNAADVSGVNDYNLTALSDATSLINLSGDETINVSALANEDLTFIAQSRAAGNEITVNFEDDYSSVLSVQDYRTVNLNLDEGDYAFTLDLETKDGTNADSTYARTLNVTGGTDDADDTSLDIGALDSALTTVDFSDFNGSLVSAEWNSTTAPTNDKKQIILNGNDFSFDVAVNDVRTEFRTEFVFTEDTGATWVIENFQQLIQDDTSTDNNNSILNFEEFGLGRGDFQYDRESSTADIEGYNGDVTFGENDATTVIMTSGSLDSTLVLTGLDAAAEFIGDNFA